MRGGNARILGRPDGSTGDRARLRRALWDRRRKSGGRGTRSGRIALESEFTRSRLQAVSPSRTAHTIVAALTNALSVEMFVCSMKRAVYATPVVFGKAKSLRRTNQTGNAKAPVPYRALGIRSKDGRQVREMSTVLCVMAKTSRAGRSVASALRTGGTEWSRIDLSCEAEVRLSLIDLWRDQLGGSLVDVTHAACSGKQELITAARDTGLSECHKNG